MNIIINGINGGMGQNIIKAVQATPGFTVVAGIDRMPEAYQNPCPVFSDLSACDITGDVVIDFSRPDALPSILAYCDRTGARPVIATTGLSQDDLALMAEYAKRFPIFHTANMSLGVNLQVSLARFAAAFLGDDFEIELIEKHHHRKVDAPSGTALMLANNINEVAGGKKEFVFGRHTKTEKRTRNELGIHAIRGGTIVGEHEILFIGNDEIIELTHKALSRQVFAQGALRAAAFIMEQKEPRIYNMNDIVNAHKAVTHLYTDANQAVVTLHGLDAGTHARAKLFDALADEKVVIDMISQSAPKGDKLGISFSCTRDALEPALLAINRTFPDERDLTIDVNDSVTKLVVAGPGMEHQAGVTARLFDALAGENIAVYAVTTSETKIACCVHQDDAERAKNAIISAFSL
ncbi:MAG: 4-hydroxy-tetrahydrodipicolinate reductase [Bacillota bacterium]